MGRGRARKALTRGCGRCVLLPCSARRCPARKSPTHALCRRACVNGRVPLGGFHNYILILSNARGLQLDNSPSTLEFPESAADIAPSRVLGARRSCGAQWSWRRLIGSARGSSEHPVIVWYGGSLPRLKLARAGRRHTHLRPISALGGRQIEPSSTPWEALLAAGRPVRGLLSVGSLIQHHAVARTVTQSTWWDAQPTTFSKNRCPAHSLGRAEVIRASTCRTLSTRQVGRYVGLWALGS